jgi:methionyl-tRNA formyltransferase
MVAASEEAMKLVFMGTPDFAAPFLESLGNSHHTVTLVVTQPDRPKGRGRGLAPPPVKETALRLGLPVAQPESLKTPEFHDLIRAQGADLLVVVAFRILPATLFPLARLGAVNVHGSLLPRYRGAAPIQWAVAHGEKETGVTVFQLDAQVDHGLVLGREKTPIGPEETSGDLFLRLRDMGRDLLLRVLDDLEAGRAKPMEQDHAQSSPAPKLKKEDGRLDWTLPAQTLHDRIRAFNPYPVCYATTSTGRVLRVHATRVVPGGGAPGEVGISEDRHPVVSTGEGRLKLIEAQWEGRPRMSGPDLVNGLQPAERDSLRFV